MSINFTLVLMILGLIVITTIQILISRSEIVTLRKTVAKHEVRIERFRHWFKYLSAGSVEHSRLSVYCKWCLDTDSGIIDNSEDELIKRALRSKDMSSGVL